jgi:nucleoside-diphosphate-sugar epimerase
MKSILITGGNGFVARNIYNFLKHLHNVTLVTRQNFDLSVSSEVNAYFENKFFDIIIHCAVVGGSRLRVDSYNEMDNNLKMYYNLHQLKNKHFRKLITFGSGAQFYSNDKPYGLSKQIIANSILHTENFYNLNIFALFNYDELDSRFIKSNILRYIENSKIVIHQDKYMDFFYMNDFLNIINFYIDNENCPKSINFTYKEKFKLNDIACMINELNDYSVKVELQTQGIGQSYIGDYNLDSIDVNLSGLQIGITETYKKLRNKNNEKFIS